MKTLCTEEEGRQAGRQNDAAASFGNSLKIYEASNIYYARFAI